MKDNNEMENTENEVVETRSKEEVSALIHEMDGEDFDPSDTVQDSEQKRKEDAQKAAYQTKLEVARGTAFKAVAGFDFLLKQADERLGLDEMQGAMLTETAAPVLVKYAVEPPEWFKQWGAELQLAGALCFVSFMQYKTFIELKKKDAREAKRLAMEQGETHGAD